MTDSSARLNLPYIAPNQAQKHVTHNEAVQRLDALTQMSVVSTGAETPPALPEPGEIHALGAAPTGDWAGQAGQLAYRTESGWLFLAPQPGWRIWDQGSGALLVHDGAGWVAPAAPTQNTEGLGIASSWDATNRLSVAAPAVLLTHDGAGHQLKINKAADAETASVLFQSNWTGHAECGLAGETAFSIKISPDGAAWQTALRLDPDAGEIQCALPVTGAAVQAAATDVTPGRLMRADYGYGPGNLVGPVAEAGGVPTGAVIESGATAGGAYTRWADGTQICRVAIDAVFDEPRRLAAPWTFPAPFAPGTAPEIIATPRDEFAATPGPEDLLAPIARPDAAAAHQQAMVRVYRVTGGTDFDPADALPLSVVALGRWF